MTELQSGGRLFVCTGIVIIRYASSWCIYCILILYPSAECHSYSYVLLTERYMLSAKICDVYGYYKPVYYCVLSCAEMTCIII